MSTNSIRKSIILSLLTFSIIMNCGCQNTENIPQITDNTISSLPQENVTDNNNIVTTVTESENVTTPADTTEKVNEPIPDEWIYINDLLYAVTHFNSITSADCSEGELSDIIGSLVEKNILFYLTLEGRTFEIDRDNPITYGTWDNPFTEKTEDLILYPAISVFFPDVKSIYELAHSVYGSPNDDVYTYDPSTNSFYESNTGTSWHRLFFTEIDGKLYVNPDCTMKKGGASSFYTPSRVEIIDEAEDKCSLVWHYSSEVWDNDSNGFKSFNYEKNFTVVYSDGAWRLTDVLQE